ncbi:DNA-binding transcriptional regulator, LysR family [Flavobacterium glycines]|uniref:DNA-binding transcriptional regulator, LysR family n=1 Tax=Flavobacterium glycines TaxID=551990 RepID=A0A1B9DTC8_9FLAO|nr:LysR family transcriptional regulator [Flavobacterium glycines]OCB72944.1 LysR family transcriptional regulator [Flavobacterium glycines]GEL10225.1 LysR family transcriptional regulator [Flavobacterium glycines]SDI76253.1 DNA-binding transcriptional regulator, LysR family [Flavobacterium glycines]
MVNLEWYRTFKSVYKNGNFSLAAKELFISQPAVSQQISMLEAHVGYKLFNRKSKGVEPTEYAKLLNNLIIEALERLENVENGFRSKAFDANRLITVGISKHLFNSMAAHLISKFDYIDFSFHENEALFELVNAKKIDFAIVTKKYDTFDTIQKKLGDIRQIIVGSKNIDASQLQSDIKNNDYDAIENWLNDQKWYSHDSGIPHIKLFWLHVFNKKRPSMIPNYIIPSEFEMLEVLSNNSGVAVCWDINASSFIRKEKLQLLWETQLMPDTAVYLLSAKNAGINSAAQEIEEELKKVLS